MLLAIGFDGSPQHLGRKAQPQVLRHGGAHFRKGVFSLLRLNS